MKSIRILFLLAFSLKGFSQDTLAKVSIHTWAGGQCCSGGTDVIMNLSDELIHLDFDSLIYISSTGQSTLLYSNDFHAVNTGVKSFCTLSYGWSSMQYGQDQYISGTTSYYGLTVGRFRIVNLQTPKLKFYRNSKVIKEGKVNEQFSMTAYP